MQSQVEYSTKGIFIPFEWFKEMGRDVHVQKVGNVILIETAQRQAARKQLRETVQQLREAGREHCKRGQGRTCALLLTQTFWFPD